MIATLQATYPRLQKFCKTEFNKNIFEYLRVFTDDQDVLVSSLVQNPFGKTTNTAEIKNHFGHRIFENVQMLNRLHSSDNSIFADCGRMHNREANCAENFAANCADFSRLRNIITLFLLNYKFAKTALTVRKAKYAMALLEKIDASEIKFVLEDMFFSFLNPEIYNNYISILELTRKKYMASEKEIVSNFKALLAKHAIDAEIQARLKTICSLHNKILRKNILCSQVMDAVGLRLIVDTVENCYRSMALILKNSPIMTSRVKDYIAMPKDNGYQSIHMTILYESYPFEMQIRTREMHDYAEFGRASHFLYKSCAF